MSEEKTGKDVVSEAVVFPPQSSLKLVSHGKPDTPAFYYTWEIKVYCDNLDFVEADVDVLNKKMLEKYSPKDE